MQTLDARHIELFLCDGFRNGSWQYELIGSHKIQNNVKGACGAIFDLQHISEYSTAGKITHSIPI